MVSDKELIERFLGGERTAFDELVVRHREQVFATAYRMVSNAETAEEIAQETFIKAFRALGGFRGDSSFRTWLLTITANEARGALRRRGRRKETALEDAGPVQSDDMGPDQAAIVAQEAGRARMMLERLPEKQRMSVSLRIEEGLSFKEIGEVIGSSEGAARVNYFHGIRRLRELME